MLIDITERKLAEQALQESERREREAADRLRALDEMKNTFLAAVSHELRSPLTSILGLSLTLERAPDIPEADRADLLIRLATNARKLDRLLKDLLDIDRLNRGIVEPQIRLTDVGAIARRTVESLDPLAGRDVSVQADPVVIGVDPAKVERIVENLLVNADAAHGRGPSHLAPVTVHDGGASDHGRRRRPGRARGDPGGDLRALPARSDGLAACTRHRHRALARRPVRRAPRRTRLGRRSAREVARASASSCPTARTGQPRRPRRTDERRGGRDKGAARAS